MQEKRVKVWVQRFKGRSALMLQWHDPNTGKRKSESAGAADEEEAEQKRSDKEYELNHGLHKDRSRMTWEKFRQSFEEEYVDGKRPATQENYRHVFDAFERLCSPQSLRSITERTISAFVAGMRKMKLKNGRDGMQPATMKVYLQFLRTALRWAVQQKMMPSVPGFPAIKVPKRRPQAVPLEAFERLLEKAPDAEMRAFFLCGWLAGLRISEAMALEWEETQDAPYLDFDKERIWLPANFVKAVEDQWLPLDRLLAETLRALPQQGRKVFVLRSRVTGERMTRGGMSMRVTNLARKAGVKMSMHSTRRGFLCRYAEKVSAQVLQRLARHSSIKTTMDYYTNVDTALEEAVLGKRNTMRNTTTPEGSNREAIADANQEVVKISDDESL
jgi:integrase